MRGASCRSPSAIQIFPTDITLHGLEVDRGFRRMKHVLGFLAIGSLAIGVAACGGCDSPTGGCGPRGQFGVVRAVVVDGAQAPIPGAMVCAREGGGVVSEVCGATGGDGVVELSDVRAGSRRVTVDPPVGYTQGSDPLEKTVLVVGGRVSDIEFMLARL